MVRFVRAEKVYSRGSAVIHAVRRVSAHINAGEFCAVTGPSGSGKSTLVNLIAGLDELTGGDILIGGRSTRAFTETDWTTVRREWIGLIFQAFHLVPGLTAEENVGLPLWLNGRTGRDVQTRVAQSLEMVNMRDRGRHRPGELSGGEQQRVAIARACVHQPRLLLADEPTGNLDSRNGADVVALLRRVSKEGGQTVIMVTHSEKAADVADCQYEMNDGELMQVR